MNDNAKKRKLLIAITLIVCIIVMLSAVTIVFYVQERKEHLRIQMGTFDIKIDVASLGKFERMEYVVCGEKTLIEPYEDEDGSVLWTEKISTPKQLLTPDGPPCPVEILIIKEGETKRYPADQPFGCPECSGWHYYKIMRNKAVYRYSP
ncbi:MAG: hypothetical protein GY797_16160 [Deltaproteobacteria bacterium]|nr:hypothetical protein [Deltaproteobacteria bacterium]